MIRKNLIGMLMIIFLGSGLVSRADVPRKEYPRPQFVRNDWSNLNGTWTYTFDFGMSGKEQGLMNSKGFENKIIVPFAPESKLSGVEHTDFIPAMWYHRIIRVTKVENEQILLNFGGIDYRSEIYIDGKFIDSHFGGSSSFVVDITDFVESEKDHNLVIYVEDDNRSREQTAGKQSLRRYSYTCLYTRVTGIWQTVWIEKVNKYGLKHCKVTPDLDNKQFVIEPYFYNLIVGTKLRISLFEGKKMIKRVETKASNSAIVAIPVSKPKLWSPDSPFLYDLKFEVIDDEGKVIDRVASYAGMRKVHFEGNKFFLNNEPFYQRLVLDQGYYPDGLWTAPSDAALKADIEMGLAAGFNGARLHQKVFEQRYLYWADKLGYVVWGESASWGMDMNDKAAARNFLTEWEECIERDVNSPSIIVWSPLNEMWDQDRDLQKIRLTNDLYEACKRIDPTRPIATASGGFHTRTTDIYAEHLYEQDPKRLYERLVGGEKGQVYIQHPNGSEAYDGEVYMIDEFGGIQWVQKMKEKEVGSEEQFWGYGNGPQDLEEFYGRLEKLVAVIISLEHIQGFCYTQIVDVELEKNGIYTYDRQRKFDMDRIADIFAMSKEKAKKIVEEVLAN
ncbi:MAG: glycoside hydrolase family 2 protein [Bacteroidales bacterium]